MKLVGALPATLENVSTYCAALFAKAAHPDAARELVAFIASPEGQAICRATGLAARDFFSCPPGYGMHTAWRDIVECV